LNWYTRRLAGAIASQGVEVSVVAPIGDGASPLPWQDGNVAVIPCYRRGSVIAPLNMITGAAKTRAEIIHVQHELFAYGGLATATVLPFCLRHLRRRGLKVLTTIHGVIALDTITPEFIRANRITGPIRGVRYAWRQLIRNVALASDAIHVHERYLRDLLIEQYSIDGHVIRVIPMGIDIKTNAPPRELARAHLGIPPDAEVALFFGYLSTYKGLAELLADIPTTLARRSKLHFLLAGDAPARLRKAIDIVELSRLSRVYGDRVHITGFVPDRTIPQLFAAADVLLLPYTVVMSASGPMALAASHGLPVLLSNKFSGSYPAAPGMFVPERGRIADAVCSFFQDPALQAASREFVRKLSAERAWPEVATAFIDAYENL